MKQIRLNAFAMNAVGHVSPGLWRHPRDRSTEYTRLGHWLGLARTLERGLFDGIFFADVLGAYDVHGGSPAAALRQAAQVPLGDPLLLVSAMATVTEHLGFGVTASLAYEAPFLLARRFSTLDHLTGGRIAWNIVTSYLDSAARAAGHGAQRGHDERYALAEDALSLMLRLWEESWEDGAVVADRIAGVYADPARVHAIRHSGPEHSLDAIHLCEPSPQRVPVLYQAGSSPAGRGFAARHAECVFVSGPTAAVIAPRIAALREAVRAAGRGEGEVLVFCLATVVVAATEAEARDLLAEYRSYASAEGALALLSGWTGIDFAAVPLDSEVRFVENDAGRSALENFTRADPDRRWTVREAAAQVAVGGNGPVFVGSASQVAGLMRDWAERTGADGFNLACAVMPESFESVVEHLVPELQHRGMFKDAYAPGTLRRKLFGRDRRTAAPS